MFSQVKVQISVPRGIYTDTELQDTIRRNVSEPIDNEITTMDPNDIFVGCE